METVDYGTAILWYAMWPAVLFVTYKFIRLNVEHLENNLESKDI